MHNRLITAAIKLIAKQVITKCVAIGTINIKRLIVCSALYNIIYNTKLNRLVTTLSPFNFFLYAFC